MHVHHEELQGKSHLRGGQADAFGGLHRTQHRVAEGAEGGAEFAHGLAHRPEDRVAVGADGEFGHGFWLPFRGGGESENAHLSAP